MRVASERPGLCRRPHPTGAHCSTGGAFVDNVPLLRRIDDATGRALWAPRAPADLGRDLCAGYATYIAAEGLAVGLTPVAQALNRGDTADALRALEKLALPAFPARRAGRLVPASHDALRASLGRLGLLRQPEPSPSGAIGKAGYDPSQPRGPDGRWGGTGTGAGAAAGLLASLAAEAAGDSFFGDIGAEALASLARFGARAVVGGGPAMVLGLLFLPVNHSLTVGERLPALPGTSYAYDRDTGVLTLYRAVGGGSAMVLLRARTDLDGVLRDGEGRGIGRDLGASVMVDPDAVLEATATRPERRAGAVTAVETETEADDNEPKLCPDPSADRAHGEKGKEYENYIHQLMNPQNPLQPGQAVTLWNPLTQALVHFDDCRQSDGTMIEAKGNYREMYEKESDYPWSGVLDGFIRQARRQIEAAGGRAVEWHFAQKPVADEVRAVFGRSRQLKSIPVIHTPMPGLE